MATTSHTPPGKEIEQYSPDADARTETPKSSLGRARAWVQQHMAFVIVLIVAVVAENIALRGLGLPSDEFVYDDRIAVIAGIFSLVVMVYPAYVAITSKQRVMPRILIMVVSTLFAFLLLAFWVRLLGPMGQDLWEVAVIGPVVLPFAATALHALAALFLTLSPKDAKEAETTIADQQALLPELEANIAKAAGEVSDAQNEHTIREGRVSQLKSAHEAKNKDAQALSAAFKEAEQAFKDTPVAKELTEAEAKLALSEANKASLVEQITQKRAELKGEKLESLKQVLQGALDDLDAELSQAVADHTTLTNRVRDLKVTAEASDEKKAMDEAQRLSDEAQEAAREIQTDLETAEGKLDEASSELASMSEKQVLATEARDKAKDAISEAQATLRGGWGDTVFAPVLCLVLAFTLYSTWYGWALAT